MNRNTWTEIANAERAYRLERERIRQEARVRIQQVKLQIQEIRSKAAMYCADTDERIQKDTNRTNAFVARECRQASMITAAAEIFRARCTDGVARSRERVQMLRMLERQEKDYERALTGGPTLDREQQEEIREDLRRVREDRRRLVAAAAQDAGRVLAARAPQAWINGQGGTT